MQLPKIKIYTGKISEWTEIFENEDKPETVCGRMLLLYGLLQRKEKCMFDKADTPKEAYQILKGLLKYGPHGKPDFRENRGIYFNISHSGMYAACALSEIPCGVDIEQIKEIRNQRIFEKVLSETEMRQVFSEKDKTAAFYKYWTRKESCLKLTGQGITVDLREVPRPIWHEDFVLQEGYAGCISADAECEVIYEQVFPTCLLKIFS